MSRSYGINANVISHNGYVLDDSYNLRSSAGYFPSQTYLITLKVCLQKRNLKYYTLIDVWSSDTVKELKHKVAYYSKTDFPLNQLFLEIFDENQCQWNMIDDSNSSITINQLKLRQGNILSIDHRNQQVSKDQNSFSLSPISDSSHALMLKLCKKPLDRTDFVYLGIDSFCTLAELRKKVYEKFNRLSNNHPIYLFNKDTWLQFESNMDDIKLYKLHFESYAFISIDYDDENFNSKRPSGLCGLVNLGSTCFMNSIFQCLSNIPEFTKRILSFNDEINAPIIGECIKLIKKIWSGKYQYINPESLLNNINDNSSHYPRYRQQDAQEFMNHFLHLIHAELSKKETFITDLFYGQIRSTVKCLQCQQNETTNESFSFLPLHITNYNQKTILYVKVDGEQCLVSIQINPSVITVGDLIDCFVKQQDLTIARERIQAVRLINNIVESEYETWKSLRSIRDNELAFYEYPEKLAYQKHIWCEFIDHTTKELFRPPTKLICPIRDCHYTHISDQIDQILGHLCSMTHAPTSAFYIYWVSRNDKQCKLNPEANIDESLPGIIAIFIEMASEWVRIYKECYNTDHSTDIPALPSLLADFFREESVDGDYHCLKCPKLTKAQRKLDLCLPLPHVLIIQLKRFTYNIYTNEKIDTYIPFPLYELDLKDYIVKDDSNKHEDNLSTKYDLVAVSNHTGTLSSGHYVTYAKNIEDGNWYLFDDTYVRKLNSDNDIVTKNAYILVYVRKT